MKTYPTHTSRAFTLIELLTVIAIIGVLSAILIPAIGRVRENANATQGISNLRQIGISLKLFASENKNSYPAVTIKKNDWNELHPNSPVGGDQMWSKQLRDYLPQKSQSLTGRENQVFVCPNAEYYDDAGNRYDINDIARTYTATEGLYGTSGGSPSYKIPRRVVTVEAPAKTLLVVDAKQSGTNSAASSVTSWSKAAPDLLANGNSTYLDFRQPGISMNVLFADGQVEAISADSAAEITQNEWTGRAL